MLKRAILYKSQLENLIVEGADDINNRYFSHTYWQFTKEISATSWDKHQFVSVDESHSVIGLLEADINRSGHFVVNMCMIRFRKENKYAFTFSKDLIDFILGLLLVYNYRKIEYTVAMGSPQEKWYDSYTEKYGGRVVGILKEHFTTESGTVIDLKLYEIFRRDFIECYKNIHQKHYNVLLNKFQKNLSEKSIIDYK